MCNLLFSVAEFFVNNSDDEKSSTALELLRY